MNNEFKKIKNNSETRYVLETATGGSSSAGVIATAPKRTGKVQARGSILAQESDKKKESKPRNFVAKNAKMGGAGAHKDKKKEQKQGTAKHKKPYAESIDGLKDKLDTLKEAFGRRSAYQRDYDSSVSGMGRPHDHRGLEQELGHERNNYAVAIDGRTWKVFADQRQAQNIARSLQAKGKNASVHETGADPTESVEEGEKPYARTPPGYFDPMIDKFKSGIGQATAGKPGSGVDAKGRTRDQWLKMIKAKFPDAKVMVSRSMDGPCQATLSDGRTLSWKKVGQAGASPAVATSTATKPSAVNTDYTPKVGDEVTWRHSDPQSKMMPLPGTVLAVAPGKVKLKIYSKRKIQELGKDTIDLDLNNYTITPKQGVAEGSVNDYFKRRKDEEDRIAGTKAPAKRTPKQTDYEKKRKEQGVAEGLVGDVVVHNYTKIPIQLKPGQAQIAGWGPNDEPLYRVKGQDGKEVTTWSKRRMLAIAKGQGVAEGKWDPYTGGDYGQTPRPQASGQGSQSGDTAAPNKEKDQAEWEAMLDYYGTNALVQRALGDLYKQTHGGGYHDSGVTPERYLATIERMGGKTEKKYFPNKQAAHKYAKGSLGHVVSFEKIDTKEETNDLITLPVMLGLGQQKKKWMLQFPDEGYAQKWEFKHKNVATIMWPAGHDLGEPSKTDEALRPGFTHHDAADAQRRREKTLADNPKIAAEVERRRKAAELKKKEQDIAEGSDTMTPNWAKYVLDQLYNSNGDVTMTDLFDEGIPGLHDMFISTAQEHGLDPDEDFQDVEHEVIVKLEDLIKGGHDEVKDSYMESLSASLELVLQEKAPPGDKYERMVKHIKKGYSKDGKLSDKEKSIAYATAWKSKNKSKK